MTAPSYNFPVHSRPPHAAPHPALIDPYLLGTICGLFSSVVYTAANSFLRAVNDLDPVWVSAVKAAPTVVLMAPVLVVLLLRGHKLMPSYTMLGAVILGGLAGQLGGNIAFQWSLSQIGVALSVPLSLGGMIVCAAIFGRAFLYEPVTPKAALALAILLASIGVLALGARAAGQQVSQTPVSLPRLAAGVAAACLSGAAYSVLNVVLRYCITRGAPLPTTLFTVALTGLSALGALAFLRIGPAGISATTHEQWLLMLGAGLCNTIAFVSLTKSLQLTSIVYVNALNATQATLAALAGVLIFREPLSPWLALGVLLTIAGLTVLAHSHRAMRAGDVD